jgi:hypothetical protein
MGRSFILLIAILTMAGCMAPDAPTGGLDRSADPTIGRVRSPGVAPGQVADGARSAGVGP